MKKLIYFGIGLALCLVATLFVGCEKNKEAETKSLNADEVIADMEASMVYVAGGTFMMGATEEQGEDAISYEKPVHEVTLDGFYIGKYEVTQAQWEAVMGTTIEQQRDVAEWAYGSSYELVGVGDAYPMYYVNWEEVNEFCAKLSALTGKAYRLPTEAEWEYAARGGQNADGTKYAGSNNIDEVAWYKDNSGEQMHPVGQKKPNGLGLYDMSGNVGEWCRGKHPVVDDWDFLYRGGCWWVGEASCRIVEVYFNYADSWSQCVGFRVVCER